LCKYPATYACTNGCSVDDIDLSRAAKVEFIDQYIDVEQKLVDAKFSFTLYVGDPMKYVLEADSGN
jgi:hypothetical protein